MPQKRRRVSKMWEEQAAETVQQAIKGAGTAAKTLFLLDYITTTTSTIATFLVAYIATLTVSTANITLLL